MLLLIKKALLPFIPLVKRQNIIASIGQFVVMCYENDIATGGSPFLKKVKNVVAEVTV